MFKSACKYIWRSSKAALWFKRMLCADGIFKTLLSKQTTKYIPEAL